MINLPHSHSGNIYTASFGSNSDNVRSEMEHLRFPKQIEQGGQGSPHKPEHRCLR
jgi:hypothetical protein